jgi:hypothetical protein
MTRLVYALTALLAAAPAFAQSNIRNADLQARPAGDLARTFEALAGEAGPIWIGYSVPAHDPDWNACCYNNGNTCCGRCALERTPSGESIAIGSEGRSAAVPLETADLLVLFRVVDRQVEKVRAFSGSCEIDAGGRRVYWLTGVEPAASVRLLGSLARSAVKSGEKKNRVADGAVMALSAHGEASAVETLIQIARAGESSHARGQALFWLAQRAGQKAAATIVDAIDNDPDTDVKTKAVFALSQLPKDEGVPKLIEVARTNRNRKVRQQAVFWLGQSRDPRALKFFEEILLKN